jgi:hypothetical protein
MSEIGDSMMVVPMKDMNDLTFFGDVNGTTWTPYIFKLDYKDCRGILPGLVAKNKITKVILPNTRLYGYKTELAILLALPIQSVFVPSKMNNLDVATLCQALTEPTSVVKEVEFEGHLDAYASGCVRGMFNKLKATNDKDGTNNYIKVTFNKTDTQT